MRLRDENGLCGGCRRAHSTCRDGVSCEYRKAFLRGYVAASVEKRPYKASERAVRFMKESGELPALGDGGLCHS